MKLLVDQNLDSRTAALLRLLGHDAVHALEIGMDRSADESLIGYAVREGRVIATLDSDFHELIVTQGLVQPSTILIREQNPPAVLAVRMIDDICQKYATELEKGCILTCDLESVRFRLLPFTRMNSKRPELP